MNDIKKPNDWFVAQLENPSFDISNFKDVGLSADNTGLLDKNTYKNSKYIQDMFKGEDGKFNEVAFNQKYDSAALTYQKFANDEFEDTIMEDVDWDPYSQLKPTDAKDRELDFTVRRVFNPDRLKTGVSQIGRTDNREWTASELAQTQKVFDYKTGKYRDYTPNDNVLFGNPLGFIKSLSEPLVLAQWDSNGTHTDPFTGKIVKHKKGELKYNEEGTYYYETLGGREAYGRKFKSAFDSFTVDGSAANKYDFFDSDGLDKSVTGTVMKTVTSLAPLFVPYVNLVYGGAMIGAQLLDILPTIYKSTLALNEDTPTANLIQGIGRTFKGSTSEYSQEHMVSAENFFNLVTDVALQWGQQRAIFKGMSKLLGTESKQIAAMQAADLETAKLIGKNPGKYGGVMDSAFEMNRLKAAKSFEKLLEKNNRMAANTALGYMAMMQGLETFEDAIEQGADRSEAAAIAWGAVAGMYAVDRTGLGELFFPELKGNAPTFRKAIKQVSEDINKGFGTLASNNMPKQRKLAKMFDTAKTYSSNYWSDIRNHTTGFIGKAVGEGLEEMSEELVVDLAKGTFNWAQDMGFTKSQNKLDAWENALERYGMNFFGGAIGGAIFYGVDVVQNRKATNEQTNQELIYLIRNGRTSELMEELDKMRKKGKLGNRNLSATKTEDTDQGTVWTSPTEPSDNQNEAVFNMTKNYLQHMDAVINQEGLNFSDEQLLDKMIMGDMRMKALVNFERGDGEKFGKAIINGYQGKMLQDFNTLTSDIVAKRNEIANLEKSTKDEDKKGSVYQQAMQKLMQEKSDLDLKKQKFLDGTYSEYYTGQMLFAIDSSINKFFYAPTFKDYVEYKTGKDFQSLSEEQVNGFKEGYEAYSKHSKMENLDTAYGIFKKLNKDFSAKLEQGTITYQDYYKFKAWAYDNLIDAKATLDKLTIPEGEDAQQVLASRFSTDRNIKPVLNKKFVRETFIPIEGESDADAELRMQAVEAQNAEVLARVQEVIQQAMSFGFMDKGTKELLLSVLGDKVSNERAVNAIKGAMITNGVVTIGNNNPLQDALLNTLNDVNGENTNEISEKLDNILNSSEYRRQLMNETLDNMDAMGMFYSGEEDPSVLEAFQDRIDSLKDTYMNAVKAIEEQVLANPYNATIMQLRRDVLQLKTSPVYDFLQQLTNTVYGSKSDIIALLEEESKRFENAPTISDYVLSGNRDKEIEQALNIIQMFNAIITASSTTDLDINQPFGHNATLNYFLETYFPKEELYGIIKDDIAQQMRGELGMLVEQLTFLQELSRMNSINQFAKHAKTGQQISKLTAEVLKGKNRYQFLKDLNYKGMYLFKDMDIMSTPTLDDIDNVNYDNPLISKELSMLQNKLYDNFQEIVNTTNDSPQVILKDLFSGMRKQFNITNLVEQKNTKFSPETKSLEDYDVYMMLHTLMALKKSDFDYYLRETLVETDANYAPLYSQEYAAYIATAMAVNPEVMNAAIVNMDTPKGTYGSELLRYYNTVMVDGIGGAGKTAVIAKLVQNVVKKYYPESEVWKVGPTKQQVDNLVGSLGSDGKSFIVEDLMSHILGEDTYAELSNDIVNSNKDSKQYKIQDFGDITLPTGDVQSGYSAAVINEDTEYSNAQPPKLVFIDEATWVNSLYMQHISNWARKNNVTIIPLGDLNQNGFNNGVLGVYNVNSTAALMVRTPKLDISLRVTNSQKDDNNKTVNAVMNTIDINYADMKDADTQLEAVNRAKDIIGKMELHYYQDDNNVLNGEKIVSTVNEEEVKTILEKDGVLGYIYDNENTPTYKMLRNMADDRIKFYTPKSVQGSEAPHFIVDINFGKYDLSTPYDIQSFMKSFYTMMSRSKEGTYIINNGLGQVIKEKQLIEDENTSNTPDPATIIDRFKAVRMMAFDAELEGYTPIKREVEVPAQESETPADQPAGDRPEATSEPIKEKPVEFTPPPASTVTGKNELENEFLDAVEGKGEESTINDILDHEPMSGIRAYGWYMRYGMNVNPDGTFSRTVKDDVVDDLNVFTRNGINYTEATLYKPKQLLVDVRNYLTFGEKFDADFLQKLEDAGLSYLAKLGTDVWNSGTFNLEIRKDDTNEQGTDIARDKQGYDKAKVEPVAFNIVYRVNVEGGKDIQFTVGKLTNPDTWQKWNNSNGKDKSIADRITKYKRWYNDTKKEILDNPGTVKYLGIEKDDISFSRATRLKKVPGQTWNLDQVRSAFPNAIISPMYLYSGNGGTAMVSKSVQGKGVVFATSNKHLKIDGEKVTESNLADMYLKMQRRRKEVYDQARARGLDDKAAKAEVAEQVPPLIRMIVANSNGAFINEYFRLSFNDMVHTADDGSTKLDRDQVKEYLGTFGSNTTAARMLVAMWNYRSGLSNFVNAYESYKEVNSTGEVRGATAVDEFNRLIDQSVSDGGKRVPWSSSIYNGFMFRLTYADAIKKDAPGMVIRPINLSRNEWDTFNSGGRIPRTLTYGVYIDPAVAKAQLSILNSIFEVLGEYISLPSNTEFTIATNGKDMQNILAQLIADNGEIEFTDGKNTFKHPASELGGMGGSFKLVSLLSSVYKLFSAGHKTDDNYIFRARGRDGAIKESGLEGLNLDIVRAVNDAGRNNYFSVINNMFNTIFHGTPIVKEGAATTTYAPFINGIYYTPRTPTSHDSRPSDFYPTRNRPEQFYIDTAIENPNFEITIDPTVLTERDFGNGVPHTRQSEFDNMLQLNIRGIEDIFSGYDSLDVYMAEARQKYEKEGDAAFDNIIKEYSSKIGNMLNQKIEARQLNVKNDPVIRLDTTIDENGMLVATELHTLLREIDKKSSSLLPKDKDGNIDMSTIQNIEYDSSNLKDFTVTLQGGQTIKGEIIDGEVNIQDTVMYSVPFDPRRDEKLKVFEEVLNDYDNLRETEIADLIRQLRTAKSLTPEAAEALLEKAKLVDSHFEGYLTDEQLGEPDILDIMEYVNSLANNKQVIDSQNCKFNI